MISITFPLKRFILAKNYFKAVISITVKSLSLSNTVYMRQAIDSLANTQTKDKQMNVQLTAPNTLMTHASTINEYRLADSFLDDVATLNDEYVTAATLFANATLDAKTVTYLHESLLRTKATY